ncbi:MAG: Crp/Fnr family transcriptional regulator [Mariprofundaceae bacterium]
MSRVQDNTSWLENFPDLESNEDVAWQISSAKAMRMLVKKDSVLFRDGDVCNGYVLVIRGSIRVQINDPDGHEIILYRVEEGQSCMLTTTCLLGAQNYPAEGVAETDVDLVMLPLDAFDSALAESALFRRFVMANIGHRISDLMLLLEDVAFGRMDVRLARLLIKNGQQDGFILKSTHKELAVELGTAREVISRLLKTFERKGLVELSRNQVTLCNIEKLHQVACQD